MPSVSPLFPAAPRIAPGLAVRLAANAASRCQSGSAARPTAVANHPLTASRARHTQNASGASTRDNRTLARDAMRAVRSAYRAGDKSSNKLPTQGRDIEARQQRGIRASYRIGHLRKLTSANIHHFRVPQRGTRIDAGNCGELAVAVARRVQARGGAVSIWSIHDVQAKGAAAYPHAFCVVGEPPSASSRDFAGWDGVWIVDGWANVVCEAPEFTAQLTAKLLKWAGQGKLLRNDDTKAWEPADEPGFLALVRDAPKVRHKPSLTADYIAFDVLSTAQYPASVTAAWRAACAGREAMAPAVPASPAVIP